MKILLAGTPHTTVTVAEALMQAGHTLVSVLCPFPKPVGRKQLITPCLLETWATTHAIPVIHVDKAVLTERTIQSALPPADVLVVADFGYLIPGWLLQHAKYGSLNIHPSLLPRWRGATPVPFTLLFGDAATGVSIIRMNEKFDMGAVVAQKEVGIAAEDTTPTLLERCFTIGADLLVEKLPAFSIEATLQPIPQPLHSPTPVTRKFTKEDGCIPLEALRHAIERQSFDHIPVALLAEYHLPHDPKFLNHMIHALFPWPGTWTIKNEKRIKILKSDMQDAALKIVMIQEEGGKPEMLTTEL
jgi:methionyl-tRNA formyltransferase